MALAGLLSRDGSAAADAESASPMIGARSGGLPGFSSFAAKAKRGIYLLQSGGPPQMDLFDYKPHLDKVHRQEVPDSVFNGQRLTGMTAGQSSGLRWRTLDDLVELNRLRHAEVGGPEIVARIAQYEMAYRLTDVHGRVVRALLA